MATKRLTLLAIALSVASLAIAVLGQTNPAPACTDEIRNNNCSLPQCRCSGMDIPGELQNTSIPQVDNYKHFLLPAFKNLFEIAES